MFHLTLIILSVVLASSMWLLILSAPRALSLVIPARPAFYIGAAFFVFGLFGAFVGAYSLHDGASVLASFLQCFIGLWLMLAPSAGLRGSDLDQQMMRRLFLMVAFIMVIIIAAMYVPDARS